MFAETLKALRKSRGITQQQLADIIGVEQSSVGKYEGKDRKIPSDSVKERIADFFGVSIDYLMGRSENTEMNAMLTSEESELLVLYKNLNDDGRETAMTTMRALASYPELIKKENPQTFADLA